MRLGASTCVLLVIAAVSCYSDSGALGLLVVKCLCSLQRFECHLISVFYIIITITIQ